MRVEVVIPKGLLEKIHNTYKELAEPVLVAIATETQNELANLKPPPPARGSNRFVSEKQRRYVMAAIREGKIEVPYKRGSSPGSQRMSRSYRLVRAPNTVFLSNSATYVNYVVGEEQSRIHRGRWKRALDVATEVVESGLPESVINDIIKKKYS
jgi:hypothetical protein